MTAIRRANYPPGYAASRSFWLGPPVDLDEAHEVYGEEPLRFVPSPGAARSRVPQLLGFAVTGLLAGMLLATMITTLAPSSPCDATALRPLAQWQPGRAPARSVRGRTR